MSDISPIGSAGLPTVGRAGRAVRSDEATASTSRGSDRVELSGVAKLLGRLHKLPDVRQDVIQRVRQEIQAGTYVTEAKIDTAIDRLADDIG